jgi:hypothetical protein
MNCIENIEKSGKKFHFFSSKLVDWLKCVSLHFKRAEGKTKPFGMVPGKIDPETDSVRQEKKGKEQFR